MTWSTSAGWVFVDYQHEGMAQPERMRIPATDGWHPYLVRAFVVMMGVVRRGAPSLPLLGVEGQYIDPSKLSKFGQGYAANLLNLAAKAGAWEQAERFCVLPQCKPSTWRAAAGVAGRGAAALEESARRLIPARLGGCFPKRLDSVARYTHLCEAGGIYIWTHAQRHSFASRQEK